MSKKRKNYSDAVIALILVAILCLVILSIPVSIFFFGLKFLNSLPEVNIENGGFIKNLWFTLNFIGYVTAFFLVAELLSKNLNEIKNKFLSTVVKYAFTFTLCWLFATIYTKFSDKLSASNLGVLYIAIFLFVLGIIVEILYFFVYQLPNKKSNLKI